MYKENTVEELLELLKSKETDNELLLELCKRYLSPSNGKYFDLEKSYEFYKRVNFNEIPNFNLDDFVVSIFFNDYTLYEKFINKLKSNDLNNIAARLFNGKICPKSLNKSIDFYKKSVELDQFNKYPNRNLYSLYSNIDSDIYDPVSANKYFNNYIKSNNLDAADYEKIVVAFHNGSESVAKNKKLEFKYAKEGIKHNSGLCYACLGDCYINSPDIVEKDLDLGLEYLEKACKLDDMNAYNILGNLYDKGKDVPKDVNKALFNYEKAIEIDPDFESPLINLGNLYYEAYKGSITLNSSKDFEKEALKYYKKYVNGSKPYSFDLYEGLLEFGNDFNYSNDYTDLDKYSIRATFCSCINNFCIDENPDFNIKEHLEHLIEDNYPNAYFLMARCLELGKHYQKDINKAIEYYLKAASHKMSYASYMAGVLLNSIGEYEKAYKSLFDGATNFLGEKYKYEVNKELMSELDLKVSGNYYAQVELAYLYEFNFNKYYVKQKTDLKIAKYLYEYAAKFQNEYTALEVLKFGLRNAGLIKDTTFKRIISKYYCSIDFASGYEKAIELNLTLEADMIFNNILKTKDYYLIEELKNIINDENKLNLIAAALKGIKKGKINFDTTHPYTKEYLLKLKEEERIEKEKQEALEAERKKQEELEKEKKKIEKEKKEKEQEKQIKKDFDEMYDAMEKIDYNKAYTLLKKNSSRLGNKYPDLYYYVKLALKIEPAHYPDCYSPDYKEKKFINNLNSVTNKILDHILNGSYCKLTELLNSVYNTKLCYISYYSEMRNRFSTFNQDLFNYMRKNLTKEEQIKAVLPLLLFNSTYSGSYPFTEYAMLFDKEDQRMRIYELGRMLNEDYSIYNLLVLKYKKLGFFAKKDKEIIINKMIDLCSGYKTFYPAYKWLCDHKVKHNIDKKFYGIEIYKNKGLIDFE